MIKSIVNDMIFHGSKGKLAFRYWADVFRINEDGTEELLDIDFKLGLGDMISEFIRVLKTGATDFSKIKSKLVTFEDAAEAQKVLDAIYTSNGEEIIL